MTLRAQRQAETRRRILLAAAELFADQGFASTTTDQIAEGAGVGKGTIFYNFANKQALFEQLLTTAGEQFGQHLCAAREGRRGWEAVEAAGREVALRVDEHPATAQLLLTELFRRERPWAPVLQQAREAMLLPLRAIVAEVAEDRFASGKAPYLPNAEQISTVAVALLGALAVTTLDRAAYAPERPVEEMIAGLNLALSGLKP